MGRAKLNMEWIKKDRTRRMTYRKRKEGLKRKMHEFTTLCDVNACAIIQAPPGDNEPDEVWPENNDDKIRGLINLYESKAKDTSGNKSYGLDDYFDERNRKMVDELEKLRKKNADEVTTKCPTWFNFMNDLSEVQLREFATSLDAKIDSAKNRLDLIKKKNAIELRKQLMIQQQNSQIKNQQLPGLIQNGVELMLTNQPQLNSIEAIPPPAPQLQMIHNYPPVDTHVQQEHRHNQSINNPNSMMKLLLDENVSDDALEIDNTGTSSYNRVAENDVYNVPRPLSYYYPVQTAPPQSYVQMQYPLLFPVVSPELLALRENFDVRDIHHYAQMMGISPWYTRPSHR